VDAGAAGPARRGTAAGMSALAPQRPDSPPRRAPGAGFGGRSAAEAGASGAWGAAEARHPRPPPPSSTITFFTSLGEAWDTDEIHPFDIIGTVIQNFPSLTAEMRYLHPLFGFLCAK